METFVVNGNIPDEHPYFVLLGERSHEMAMHIADYVASLELPHRGPGGPMREILPMTPAAWLAEHVIGEPSDIAVVAMLGPLDASDEMQLELLRSGIGDRCLIVTDSEAEVPKDWSSVIKLRSSSSWEACWLEGMKVVLTVLLLPAVDRGLVRCDVTEVLDDLKGRWSCLMVVNADRGERLPDLMLRAAQMLAKQANCAVFDTLIAIIPRRPDILMKEVHSGMEALRQVLSVAHFPIILPDHEENGPNSVRLIAGLVQKPQAHLSAVGS